ncbi:hypothetical protein Q7O_002324 [Pectobacterium carotovorum subsp. carotovorum PCCS1]|nr:hypothetical protein [Pectobacterium carotovorum subsp. carotovorum PCCS1]
MCLQRLYDLSIITARSVYQQPEPAPCGAGFFMMNVLLAVTLKNVLSG